MATTANALDKFNIADIDEVPHEVRASTRTSVATNLYDRLIKSKTGTVKIEPRDGEEATLRRLYATLVQWRTRNKDKGLGIRMFKGALYLWIDSDEVRAAGAARVFDARSERPAPGSQPRGRSRKGSPPQPLPAATRPSGTRAAGQRDA